MKSAVSVALICLIATAATGCGSTMRNMLERDDPPEQQASVRQELTMPPDLRLAEPGTAPASPPEAAPETYGTATPAPVMPATPASADRPHYGDDIYTQAGISVTKPDGTRKSDAELREEMRQYYIAKKKQKNSNYGTVFNIGNIFKDE